MRVLLPLRKVVTNKQASSSSLSDLDEEEEGYREETLLQEFEQQQQSHQLEAPFPDELSDISLNSGNPSTFPTEPSVAYPASQSTGNPPLESHIEKASLEKETDLRDGGSSPLGKRKASLLTGATTVAAAGDSTSVTSKKRPALDRKPSARDLSKMVAGTPRRGWLHHRNHDDERRVDSAEIRTTGNALENDPSSARGDMPQNDDDVQIDFKIALKKRGLEIREQDGDGNCLFRAISFQVYGDPSMHGDVRKQCLDFMDRDKEHFSQFVTGEPFDQYVERKRQDGVHGNNPEIQAISELFNRPVEVFTPENGDTPLNIFHAEYKTADAPIRLSYHDGNHYNAVVDPLVPTAGLGLGLPGLQPGLADKMQMAKAVRESDAAADQQEFQKALKNSESDELQRAIKESKLSAEHRHSNEAIALSDMDATYFELEQAALEQSLQSYSNFEHGKKQKASSKKQKASSSTSARRHKHGRNSPSHPSGSAKMSSSIPSSSAVASLPKSSANGSNEARIPPPVAAAASVATAAASIPGAAKKDDGSSIAVASSSMVEYPQVVQELVMNGFKLNKVVQAYELVGDSFEDLLAFLISNTG